MDRRIDSEIYDRHILEEGMQFQIDIYYRPKRISDRRRIEEVLKQLDLKRGEKVLDVGCGVGTFAFHASEMGCRSTGIDYSSCSIDMAKELSRRFGTAELSCFIVGDAISLPFKDAFFDKVVSADFIEHILFKNKVLVLKEIRRVTKRGGTIIISTPNVIRERIGLLKALIEHILLARKIPTNPLHCGLIGRFKFERLLTDTGFSYKRYYFDESRPFLGRIPFIRDLLSIHIMWKILA